jgi:hypothetical protein
LVDSLFALVVSAQPAFAPAGALAPRIGRPSGGFGIPLGTGFRNYFASDIRKKELSS